MTTTTQSTCLAYALYINKTNNKLVSDQWARARTLRLRRGVDCDIHTRARRIIIIIIIIIRTYYYITRVYTRSCIIIVYVVIYYTGRVVNAITHHTAG